MFNKVFNKVFNLVLLVSVGSVVIQPTLVAGKHKAKSSYLKKNKNKKNKNTTKKDKDSDFLDNFIVQKKKKQKERQEAQACFKKTIIEKYSQDFFDSLVSLSADIKKLTRKCDRKQYSCLIKEYICLFQEWMQKMYDVALLRVNWCKGLEMLKKLAKDWGWFFRCDDSGVVSWRPKVNTYGSLHQYFLLNYLGDDGDVHVHDLHQDKGLLDLLKGYVPDNPEEEAYCRGVFLLAENDRFTASTDLVDVAYNNSVKTCFKKYIMIKSDERWNSALGFVDLCNNKLKIFDKCILIFAKLPVFQMVESDENFIKIKSYVSFVEHLQDIFEYLPEYESLFAPENNKISNELLALLKPKKKKQKNKKVRVLEQEDVEPVEDLEHVTASLENNENNEGENNSDSVPSSVSYSYAKRVYDWFVNPDAVYNQNLAKNLSKNKVIACHRFTTKVDNYIEKYGKKVDNGTSDRVSINVFGEIEFDDDTKKTGLIEYCFYKGLLYHRWFRELSFTDLSTRKEISRVSYNIQFPSLSDSKKIIMKSSKKKALLKNKITPFYARLIDEDSSKSHVKSVTLYRYTT